MGIIILHSLQMWVLLENNVFPLHKIVNIAGIIRVAGIIQGRVELVSKDLNHLAAILHFYAGGLNFMK